MTASNRAAASMDPFCWWLVCLWIDGFGMGQAPSGLLGPHHFERINNHLHGRILDFTHNHHADHRLWSNALQQKRDLYVYLPPGFDPVKKYPLAIFLHGAAQDEEFFLQFQAHKFDQAIAAGLLPPFVVAAPDGSLKGRVTYFKPATFWANSRAGCFEDWVMEDVWHFMHQNFPLRPERDAHAILGVSMGGSAAFAHAIKHRDRVKTAIGVHPLLNLLWVDCHGKYRSQFDPECWGERTRLRGLEVVGRRRLFTLRFHDLYGPLFGHGGGAVEGLAGINPLDLMERTDLRPGELNLLAAYGGKDEFNVAAQVESFLYCARQRGVEVDVCYDPSGKHNLATGLRMLPEVMRWASERIPRD
jgi:S-formylglutathione hydrolase FrmB